jgi:chemotaxis protein MotA
MNISSPIGFLIGLMVIGYAMTSGIENPKVFLDAHALVIVLGGTAAVGLIMFPFKHFLNIGKVYLRVITGRSKNELFDVIKEIVEVAKAQQAGKPLNTLTNGIKNPFFKEALELIAKGGFTEADLEEVLEKRLQTQNEEYKHNAATYKTLGKFPPAFGLTGATLGMISVLQGLGQEGAFERLGPAMSVALVATFYGLVTANVFIIPMGEKLHIASQHDLLARRMVIDGVHLLQHKKHPLIVDEYLRSYLMPYDRLKISRGKTA